MTLIREMTAAFAGRHFGEKPVRVDLVRLAGGLQSAHVMRARAVFPGRVEQFVLKTAAASDFRERIAYERLLGTAGGIAPRLLGAESRGTDAFLFLEWIPGRRRWPWRDAQTIVLVLRRLAEAHEALAAVRYPAPLAAWDYDRELEASAASTLELAERLDELAGVSRALPALRRAAASVAGMRRQLRREDPLPGVLHGDVHSGNVILRSDGPRKRVVFLDWGRVRTGSALEDVCSWLKSLACWEPEALRRHDTLLRAYLEARGVEWTRHLRRLYWIAGASNALSGALRYELAVAADPERGEAARARALAAAAAWMRIVRRADFCWA